MAHLRSCIQANSCKCLVNSVMKKEIRTAILIVFGLLAFLWLEKPLRAYLESLEMDYLSSYFGAGIVVRTILILVMIRLVRKLDLLKFTALCDWKYFKNLHAMVLPMVFILSILSANWANYTSAKPLHLLLFITINLAVGFMEELSFRGVVLPLFIRGIYPSKHTLLLAAISSSLLFGAIHFVNLFSQPDNIVGITSQVFFALSIGVFFCGLMLRTENIYLPSIFHALVNISMSSAILQRTAAAEISTTSQVDGADWASIIGKTIVFGFIFLSGVYMILKSDKEENYQRLNLV